MIRYAVLLINMLGLFIYKLFVADGVTVTQSFPADLKPGSEYTIELTINKGGIGGFAKLQQELPEGITATAVDSKGASFSFSGNAVKFIWTSLPAEPEFKINYKIAVAANAPTGEKMIAGKFFYVTDNIKQSVDIPESKLNISSSSPVVSANETTTPVPDTPSDTDTKKDETEQPQNVVEPPKQEVVKEEPETPVQNNTDNSTPVNTPSETATKSESNPVAPSPSPANTENGLNCVRKITASGEGEYTVELFITRGSITGFGKIQENLPAGLTASPVQGSGSSFSFADQKVKLVWVSFPTDAEFKVVYKLTGTPAANSSVDGLLSYIENDETKKIIIAATPVSSGDQQTTTQVNEPVKTVTDATQNTTTENNLTTPVVPQIQASVHYKVQICALRQTPVEASYFTTRFGFSKVDTELHEGWSKYTVGGFNEYKDARDNREDVRTKGVVGPFVTAYNTGKRITVQEALMITSQKWYK